MISSKKKAMGSGSHHAQQKQAPIGNQNETTKVKLADQRFATRVRLSAQMMTWVLAHVMVACEPCGALESQTTFVPEAKVRESLPPFSSCMGPFGSPSGYPNRSSHPLQPRNKPFSATNMYFAIMSVSQ